MILSPYDRYATPPGSADPVGIDIELGIVRSGRNPVLPSSQLATSAIDNATALIGQ